MIFLVVGLGNPGREYSSNRHNVGFMAVDTLCKKHNIRIGRMQSKALVGSGVLGDHKLVVAKPQTFMNLSGQSVSALMRFHKISLEQLLVIHDDLDLPLGTLRMRASGSAGGQKGLKSIIQMLGTNEFPRLRIGIGRPPGRMDPADYVLQNFTEAETQTANLVLDRCVQAVQVFVEQGVTQAMNQFNGTLSEV